MRQVTFQQREARAGQPVALTDNERVLGAAVDGDTVYFLVEVAEFEASPGADSAALLEWLGNLDGEALDRRVNDLLQDAAVDETYGVLYLKALKEAAGG